MAVREHFTLPRVSKDDRMPPDIRKLAQRVDRTFITLEGILRQFRAADSSTPAAWGDITGVPATFPPSAHVHSAADITSGNLDDDRLPTDNTTWDTGAGTTLTLVRRLQTNDRIRLIYNDPVISLFSPLVREWTVGLSGTSFVVRDNSGEVDLLTIAPGTGLMTVPGPITASGGVLIDGGTFAAGKIYKNAAAGLVLAGATGSLLDFAVTTPSGVGVITMETGTQNIQFSDDVVVLGDLGVGLAPSTPLHVAGQIRTSRPSVDGQYFRLDGGDINGIYFQAVSVDGAIKPLQIDNLYDPADTTDSGNRIVFRLGPSNAPVEYMRLASDGQLLLGTTVVTGAASGEFVIPNSKWLRAVNNAGNAVLGLLQYDSSDFLRIGVLRSGATVAANFSATHYISIRDGVGNNLFIPAMNAAW